MIAVLHERIPHPRHRSTAAGRHALYLDHQRWLRSWLQRRLGCASDAGDLTHEAYAHLLSSQELPPPRAFPKLACLDLQGATRRPTTSAGEMPYRRALKTLIQSEATAFAQTRGTADEALVAIAVMLSTVSARYATSP